MIKVICRYERQVKVTNSCRHLLIQGGRVGGIDPITVSQQRICINSNHPTH